MRRLRFARSAGPSTLGLLAGIVVSTSTVALGTAAVAERGPSLPGAILEATHLPPLLTVPGENVKLTFDVHCAGAGVDDPEQRCAIRGTLFVRAGTTGPFEAQALQDEERDGLRQLTAVVPERVAHSRAGFDYYADIEANETRAGLVVPPGGAAAPYHSYLVPDAVDVDLAVGPFGSTGRGTRVVSMRWGDSSNEVGLEPGKTADPIGVSSFDVDADGSIVLLDEAHRRALRWAPAARHAVSVPLPIDGRIADLTIDDDGTLYVLESVAPPGRSPLVRRFDETGRELDVVETAERSPAEIRIGPDGPVVLEHPSHQWMPVASGGSPVAPGDQRRRGRVGRPLRSGSEVLVLRGADELRLALVSSGRVLSAWRVSSSTPLGEVQLAEPLGRRLVVVVRAYTDDSDEFRVLVLDRRGLVRQFSVASADWAETAPLSRFRLVGRFLYHLGSTASGAFVDRYDLEVQ